MEGWIKVHRKLLDNPIITKDSDYLSVWIYLLLNATHKEYDTLFRGERIVLQKGQLLTGTISISQKLKINKDKVQRILKSFENDKQIEQQTSNRNRLISIVNWNEYQEIDNRNDKQMINKCETDDKQVITNKNVKNIKNDKNNNILTSEDKSSLAFAKANKHKYGEYKNVLLKDKELQSLKGEYQNWKELITYLDEYIEMKGYKAKSHYLCIKKWVVEAVKKENDKQLTKNINNKNTDWLKEELENAN